MNNVRAVHIECLYFSKAIDSLMQSYSQKFVEIWAGQEGGRLTGLPVSNSCALWCKIQLGDSN